MDWKHFGAGVGFLIVAYFTYKGIQRRKRIPDNSPNEAFSVLEIESWGTLIICLMIGTVFIIKSFF